MLEEEELPEELKTLPEKRLVSTLLTKSPSKRSLVQTAIYLLFIALFSQINWLNLYNISEKLPAIQSHIVNQGEIWRLFTSLFIHGDIAHLLSNLYMLGIFSYFILSYYGEKTFFFLTFVGGPIVNLISILTYSPHIRLLGASGLVYLLGGFWLILYMFIQKQHSLSKRIVRTIGMALMVFFPTSFEATTSYRTHFIGFLLGCLWGLIYYFLNKKWIKKEEYSIYI